MCVCVCVCVCVCMCVCVFVYSMLTVCVLCRYCTHSTIRIYTCTVVDLTHRTVLVVLSLHTVICPLQQVSSLYSRSRRRNVKPTTIRTSSKMVSMCDGHAYERLLYPQCTTSGFLITSCQQFHQSTLPYVHIYMWLVFGTEIFVYIKPLH